MAKQPPRAPVFRPQGGGEIPPIPTHPREHRNAPSELLRVHQNVGASDEAHLGNLDDVDRSQWPDAAGLPYNVMGTNHEDQPTVAPNHPNQRLTGRSSLKSHGTAHGDASSTGNKHALNSGGSPSRQRTRNG